MVHYSQLEQHPQATTSSSVSDFVTNLNEETDLENDDIELIEHFKYKQDLERKLTVTSIIGLGFSLMGVPFGISSTLSTSLIDGGNVTILWGWIVVWVFSLCVILSLSEIVSRYPTSGGVYHFSALLASEKYSLLSSWITGWFLVMGNWTYAITILFSGSQFILSIFGLKDVYYKKDPFLILIIYFFLLGICGFINFKFSRYLEKINRICIYWSIYTVLIIDILLIFFAKNFHGVKYILTNFNNSRSGYPDAIAFCVGLQSSLFTLTGYGFLPSMTDEVKKPEKNMPKGMISSLFISGVFGIVFIIPILTILPELSLLLDTNPDIMPIDLVFKLATESSLISFLLVLLLIGSVFFQSISALTTASRTTYVFARDGGLPFKDLWTHIDSVENYKIPRNALFLSMFVCAIASLLSLVSSATFNAFMSASIISLSIATGIPIVCSVFNKRRKIKSSSFKLKKLGWIINVASIFWVVFSFFILCFPPAIKGLTWSSMNYASVVFLCFMAVEYLGYYMWGFKSFKGPEIDHEYFELQPMQKGRRDTIIDDDGGVNENENENNNDDVYDKDIFDDNDRKKNINRNKNRNGGSLHSNKSNDLNDGINEDENEIIFEREELETPLESDSDVDLRNHL